MKTTPRHLKPNPKRVPPKPSLIKVCLGAALAVAGIIGALSSTQAAVKGKRTPSASQAIQSNGQTHAPEGTPTWEIQQIEVKMDNYDTRPNPPQGIRANNSKIKRDILTGAFDLRELARLAMDKHWSQLSPDEQNKFVNLLTDILETKAIFSKEQTKTQGKAYAVQYLGDTYSDNKTQAKTRTKVVVPSENVKIEIDYKLKRSNAWRIYDVIVDDASLVDNYRYQFDAIISKHGYPELVRRMQKKLAELQTTN